MLAKLEKPWFACSPDGITVFELDVGADEAVLTLACIEIKTAVASSTIENRIANVSADVIRCDVGDSDFFRLVPRYKLSQDT